MNQQRASFQPKVSGRLIDNDIQNRQSIGSGRRSYGIGSAHNYSKASMKDDNDFFRSSQQDQFEARNLWSSISNKVKENPKWFPGLPTLQGLQETDMVLYKEQWIAKLHLLIIFIIQVTVLASVFFKETNDLSSPINQKIQANLQNLLWLISGISAIAAFLFLTNKKTYEVYDFEQLYYQLGGGRFSDDTDKYQQIKAFMENKFKEFKVEFTARKRFDEENPNDGHLDLFQRFIIWPLVKISSFCCSRGRNALDFVKQTKDNSKYLKIMQVKVWELDEIYNLYFLYVNPIFIFCAHFNGLEILIIDIASLFLIDFLIDQAKSQVSGERFLHSVFKVENDKAQAKLQQKKQERGEIVKKYIQLKKRQNPQELE